MNESPWLSIVMPTYNGGKYLLPALRGIVAQGDSNIEVIAIDDGSTDETLDVLTYFRHLLPLTIIRLSHCGNWTTTSNLGLRHAVGEWVCILHQDDAYLPGRLHALKTAACDFPSVGFILHASKYSDALARFLGHWTCPLPPFKPLGPEYMLPRFLIQNFVAVCSTTFKRKLALEVGGFNETLWYASDWDLWLKLANKTYTLYIDHSLAEHRVHNESQTVRREPGGNTHGDQLSEVLEAHLLRLDKQSRERIREVARFSVRMNRSLLAAYSGREVEWRRILLDFLALGPFGCYQYARYSRIYERVRARRRIYVWQRMRAK